MSWRRAVLPLLFLFPVAAAADVHPNAESGFAPEKAFQMGEVDNVNTFNGNLVLTIPIGRQYPVGGGLGYGLTLVYNSTPWVFQQRIDSISGTTFTQAYPEPRSNAGLGWQVSLGRLFSPGQTVNNLPANDSGRWIYQGPDGNEHIFYDQLHHGDAAVAGVSYTRDGSYLRMKTVGSAREVEFPDGTVHRFDGTGRLVQMRNRFTVDNPGTSSDVNLVSIAYNQPWTITDSHGRVQKIHFKTLTQSGGPGFSSIEVVDRIELTAFGGTPAVYTFNYTPATIRRPCPHNDGTIGTNAQVQLLTSVTLPDGSSYSMPGSDYVIDAPSSGVQCLTSGSIRGLKLPTLGKVEWTYQQYTFPDRSSDKNYRRSRAGVGTRRVLDASGALLGQWTYATSLTPSGITLPQGPVYEEMVNKVTDPLGNRREHYFSVYIDGGVSSFEKEDYSLPFSRYTGDGAGRFLSTKVYDASNVLKRSTYVRYQRDQRTPFSDPPDVHNLNRREETSRTVFHDDGNRYTEVTRSGFDGLGHYRTSQTGSSFPDTAAKTVSVGYNPGAGTYQLNASGVPQAGFTMWPSSSPWVLETYTEQKTTQGADVDHTLFCFDAATGFLKRTRVLRASPSLWEDDVMVVQTADAGGNLASESYHGADTSPTLSRTDTCSSSPGAAQYTVNHTWQYGVLATSQPAGVSFKSMDRTIDVQTGLPLSSRDTAGLATAYKYDGMGRLTWAQPAAGHGAWTEMVYQIASSGVPAKLIVRKRGNGSETAGVIVPSQYHFDSLGRLWKELTFLPSGTWGVRETQYNAAGWKSQVSEVYPLNGSTTAWTKYLGYDAFGRPGTVRPPDGSSHDATFNYFGTRLVTRTVRVGTAYNAGSGTVTENPSATTETYDGHGRLIKVVEPSAPDGSDVATSYEYDAADRLVHVKTEANVTQHRWFTYDGRGFLTSEDHPEKGAAGNGKVQYDDFDAKGHATRSVDGPNDLTYVYDAAERLTDVRETGGLQRLLKKYTYDTAPGLGKGKVAQATRYNYPLLGGNPQTVQITETYAYQGVDGRASKRDTAMTFNGTPAEAFTQSFTWTALGDADTLTYPACVVGRCPLTGTRTVSNSYTNGLLTSVSSGGVTYGTVGYHLNRMVSQVSHANGVTDTQTIDASGMARPGSLTSAFGSVVRWTTGDYKYDGAGNITKMGTSWFTYDKVSRLTTGTVFTGTTGGGTPKQQTYTFDAFGNLTEVVGSPGRTIPVDPSTNRLVASTDPSTLTGYDAAGNLTAWNGAGTYSYDAFNQMWRMKNGSEEWLYLYTADGERLWSFKVGANFSRWTLRDLSNRLVREYTNNAGVWSLTEDYLHRGDLLLASETPSGRQHFHLDHLGTPRLITNAAGAQLAYHVYYPFGEEATAFNQNAERRKFTGHERDLASLAGVGDDLDYMHARHTNPLVGRFLSVDPAAAKPRVPQSWNRYAYTVGNPQKFVDPDGQALDVVVDIGFVGYDLYDIAKSIHAGKGISLAQGLALAVDAGSVALPFVTGGGLAVRLASKAGHIQHVAGSAVVTAKTLSQVLETNKLWHVFGKERHRLSGLVEHFGSEQEVARQVVGAMSELKDISTTTDGLFKVVVQVGGEVVEVTGKVVDGVAQIGTFYVVR